MKNADRNLKASASKGNAANLAQAIADLPVPLTIADFQSMDMPIIAANKAFFDLSGYDRDEVIGRNCRFLQADLDNGEARAELKAAFAQKCRAQVILRNQTKDGAAFQNFLTVIPITEPNAKDDLVLGAQFLLTEDEAERLNLTDIRMSEGEMSDFLSRKRSLIFERRRILIDAAVKILQSALLLNAVSSERQA